jgi:chromosome segregation ATPase
VRDEHKKAQEVAAEDQKLHHKAVKKLQDEINQFKDALRHVKEEKVKCEEDVDELRRQHATLTDDVVELAGEKDALMKQNHAVTEQIEELNIVRDSLSRAQRDLIRQKEELLRHIEALTKKSEALKGKIQQQESLLRDFETRRVCVQEEINADAKAGVESARNNEAAPKMYHRNVDNAYAEQTSGVHRTSRSSKELTDDDKDDAGGESAAGLVDYRRKSAVVKAHVAKKQLQDEIEQLDDRKMEALMALGEVKRQVEEVQHELKERRSEWEETDTRCDIAQIELEQMELRYAQVVSDIKDAESRRDLARADLECAQHRHAEVCSAIGDADKRLDKIKAEIRGVQQERKQVMEQLEDAQRRRGLILGEVTQLLKQQKELQHDVDNAKVSFDTSKRQPMEAAARTQTQTHIHELADVHSHKSDNKPTTRDGDDARTAEIRRLNSVLGERELEVHRLGVLLEDKGAALAALELRKTELEGQVNMLEV